MITRENSIVLYGSYGYTGRLIAQECRSKNLNVILSGRNRSALEKQSVDTGYPFEVVDIDDTVALDNVLRRGLLVIHCGGPFQFTAKKMVEACLRTETHYTDITGEYQVFEGLQTYDGAASKSRVMILPGAGFDVVPSDCLALHLKQRLPDATHVQLAFKQTGGGLSRGTTKTMIEGLGFDSVIRSNGVLTHVPLGSKVLHVNFSDSPMNALNIPWGDISTAWRSTNIPNIEIYMGARPSMIRNAKLGRYLGWLLRQRWIKNYLLKKVDQKPDGPPDSKRIKGKSLLWGKVWNSKGEVSITRLDVPNGYTLTAMTSVAIAQKIMSGKFKPGYQTPATAYGANFILEVVGTSWQDES